MMATSRVESGGRAWTSSTWSGLGLTPGRRLLKPVCGYGRTLSSFPAAGRSSITPAATHSDRLRRRRPRCVRQAARRIGCRPASAEGAGGPRGRRRAPGVELRVLSQLGVCSLV